jgi:uncharacterized protein involved in outer membrane biogenesis
MKRLILAITGGLLVVLVALVLYLTFGDLSRFRPDVEAAVSRAAGREFRITGEFTPRVFPRPSLVAEGVTLANAEWGTPMPMLSVGKASVEVALWSLVSGPIRIKKLELHDIAILLEENASGARNWSADTAEEPPAASSGTQWQGLPAIIELASIGNVTVLLKRPEQEDLPSALAKLDLRTDEQGVMSAEGSGQVGDTPFTLSATVEPTNGSHAQIDVKASIADTDVLAKALLSAQQLDLEATVSDFSRLAAAFSVDALPAGALELDGKVLFGADRYELRDATAKFLGAEARLQGIVPHSADAPLELDVALSAPDLAAFRAGLPAIGLTSKASALILATHLEVDPLAISVGDSDFSGKLVAELGDAVSLIASGESKLVDLRPFQEEPAESSAHEPADVPAEKGDDRKWLFGEEELPFERIASTTIDAKVSIATLRSRDAEAHDVAVELASDGKTLRLATTLAAEGGSLQARAELAVANDRADLDILLDAQDLRINVVSGEVDDPSQIPPIGVSAKLHSSGSSPRALAAAANGHVILTQGKGRVDNSAVGLVSGDIVSQVFSALNPFAKDEKHMNWECTVVAVHVVDGVGTIDPMLAQAEKLMISGGGTVDLRTEKLDIEFNTKPRSGVGITADMFVTPFVKIGGTLTEPGVGMNATGTLMSGGAAALTGGISVLVQGLADRVTGERDQCAKALEQAAGGPA